MNDRQTAAKWAWDLVRRDGWCILDTETTGLENTDEICQIAIVDHAGNELLNSLVRPTVPINPVAEGIHGISEEMVRNAPTFEGLLIPIMKAVGRRDLLIYNCEFDLRLIRQSAGVWGVPLAFPTSDRRQCRVWLGGGGVYCAMEMYSQWVGEWHHRYGNYRWQRLPGGDHSALGDCKAVLEVLRQMADDWESGALQQQLQLERQGSGEVL